MGGAGPKILGAAREPAERVLRQRPAALPRGPARGGPGRIRDRQNGEFELLDCPEVGAAWPLPELAALEDCEACDDEVCCCELVVGCVLVVGGCVVVGTCGGGCTSELLVRSVVRVEVRCFFDDLLLEVAGAGGGAGAGFVSPAGVAGGGCSVLLL